MFRRSTCTLGKALVLAETMNGKLVPSTLSAITAAASVGDVTALVAGKGAKSVAESLKNVNGVKNVIVNEAAQYDNAMPENLAPLVTAAVKEQGFTHVVAASGAVAKGVLPRSAAKFDSMPISDIAKVVSEDTFVRATYAGNAIATVKSSDAVKFMTVRPTNFDKAATEGGSASVSDIAEQPAVATASWVEDIVAQSDKPELTAAPVVVAGGRGLKEAKNFKLLDDLAAPLKAAVGATRAVVDAEWVPNEYQVGQTGKVVAPPLYIAVGLSGAIQHVAGMKDSKTIVAINTDADAPIFSVADYGLVEDCFTAVPELTKAVQ